ncbi:MAG: hypothetical protein ACREP6_11140 [Candidatus Binataceae bacterium]
MRVRPEKLPTAFEAAAERQFNYEPGERQPRLTIVAGGVWIAALIVLCIHGALLVYSIPDYRVTIDSAYHVSLGRYYGQHGTAFWDHINFGPRGRPNLQGPALHFSIGMLGRVLGGRGYNYVTANAILAVIQWLAAMGTAGFFALELGGEWAMLFAVSLLSGAAFAATSFAVGIPSGWIFILTPWAIYFFLRDRLLPAILLTTGAIYVHIAGYVTAPIGVLIAAALTRKWRALLIVGLGTFILTLPYTVHIIRYYEWFSGVHSIAALLFDPLLDILAIVGFLVILRHPLRHPFLLAWVLAPIAWLFQDSSRFILQEALAGSVVASLLVADLLGRIRSRRKFLTAATAFVVIATIFPLGVPSLASEVMWDYGLHFPRAVDWSRARSIADVIKGAGLTHELIADYMPALCPAVAVFASISCEKGHWVEVQPKVDQSEFMSAGDKAYVLPLKPDDPVLTELESRGWVHVYGGAGDNAVATLGARPPASAVAPVAKGLIAQSAGWLGEHAVNNSMTIVDGRAIFLERAKFFRNRHRELDQQRVYAGRLELAALLYAYSLEPARPVMARQMRNAARGFGVIAGFLSDPLALDFQTTENHRLLKKNLLKLAAIADHSDASTVPDARFMSAINRILDDYFHGHDGTFAERSSRSEIPYLGNLP